jgi:putative transposase
VALREALRWHGKIMGASVSREAAHWYLAIQVDVPDYLARRRRTGDAVTGVDLGVTSAATLSSGEKIAGPRPLKGRCGACASARADCRASWRRPGRRPGSSAGS